MLQIGNLKLKSRLILAPLAGVSDLPFRMLNRKFGCELAFTEMLNCRSLSYKSRKTKQMLFSDPKDRPLGTQLLGNEPKFIQRALEILEQYKFDIIDFNAACPTRKVVRRGEGAALLKNPKKLSQLLKIIVKNIKIPVTVKIRMGWDRDSVNIKKLARVCEDSGIDGIFVHGRTSVQGYSGTVDYKAIQQVKRSVKIPVIASGDILSPQLAKKMFDETGCDGILIARGALGNPWIFKQIKEFLKNRKIINIPAIEQIAKTMIKHLNMYVDFYGERNGVKIFRKYLIWYTKGLRNVRPFRAKISYIKTKDSAINIIQTYLSFMAGRS
ncbi:MAG: tRNA dihydrouridine synthase DusB [Candidatus Omnitrophota bacterium]